MAMLDQPAPQAMSATRAGGSASRRSWTSAIAGSHSWPSRLAKSGPVGVALGVAAEVAELLPGDAAAGAEGLLDGREGLREGHAEAGHRRHVRQRVLLDQHLGVPGRKRVAPLAGRRGRVVDLEDPGNRLLLQPLARVALGRAGRLGEPGGGEAVALAERPVVAEAVAQVDGHELVGAEGGSEEALGEGVALRFVGLTGHGSSLAV